MPLDGLRGHMWRLVDPTHDVAYDRNGHDLVDGLFVRLGAVGLAPAAHRITPRLTQAGPTGEPGNAISITGRRIEFRAMLLSDRDLLAEIEAGSLAWTRSTPR